MLRSLLRELPVLAGGLLVLILVKAVLQPSDAVAYVLFLLTVAIVVPLALEREDRLKRHR